MAPEEKEEYEKCKESPAYFYNKYVKPDGFPDATDEDFKFPIVYPKRRSGWNDRLVKAAAIQSRLGKTIGVASLTKKSYNQYLKKYLEHGGDPEMISWLDPDAKMTGLRPLEFDGDPDMEMVESAWPKMPDIPGKAIIITSMQTILNGNKFQDLWNESQNEEE